MTQRGFTLIEMLIALALFSILLTVTYGAISHAVRVRDAVRARVEALHAANAFFSRLQRELTSAYVETTDTVSGNAKTTTIFLGLNHDSDVAPRDALAFTCNCGEVWTYGMIDSNRIPHTEVAYDFVYDNQAQQTLLMRREDDTIDNDAQTGGQTFAMWDVIRGMNLRYLDSVDGQWKDSWDSRGQPKDPLPQAVEVTLWLAQPEADDQKLSNPLIVGRTFVIPTVTKKMAATTRP